MAELDTCYEWDEQSHTDVVFVTITRQKAFVRTVTRYLSEGYQFLTKEEAARGVPNKEYSQISNTLLGSISEFAIYIVRRLQEDWDVPFIGCFRAADPLGKANFPLVDIRIFQVARNPKNDLLCLQEIKTTRDNPKYFSTVLSDYAGLYERSRLTSTAEHLKFDLQHAGKSQLVRRVNDCIGTCPGDSTKVRLTPTGVSCDRCDSCQCIAVLQDIVASLRADGWSDVNSMYARVPNIEQTYLSFALGEGDIDG